MKTLRVTVCVCSVLLINAVRLCGQFAPGAFADANHPAGPPDPQKIDAVWQVDPISDQVTINIPFTTTPEGGRGPKLPFALLYNSASTVTLQDIGTYVIAVPDYNGQSTIFDWSSNPESGSSTAPAGPWTTTGPYIYYSVSNYLSQTNGGGQTLTGCDVDGPFIYVDENGSAHDMNLIGLPGVSPNQSGMVGPCELAEPYVYPQQQGAQVYWPSSSTYDGSDFATTSGSAVGPDGTSATASETDTGAASGNTTLTDPNGNAATLALNNGIFTATDALGRTVYTTNIPIGSPGQIPAGSYSLTTYGESGSTETYAITFSQKSIGTFTMPHPTAAEIGVTGAAVNSPGNGNPYNTFTAVTNISRPDSTSYGFTYDPTYGTISTITFPTGGYVRFCWGIRNQDWNSEGTIEAMSSIVVIAAFTSTGTTGTPGTCSPPTAGSSENQWTYALESATTSPPAPIGQVTNPDGSYTEYMGVCLPSLGMSYFSSGGKTTCKESSRAMYDSGGNLKESVAQSFDGVGNPLQVATTLYDGPSPLQQLANYVLDGYENVTEKDESDYYACNKNSSGVWAGLCTGPTQSANLPAPGGGWLRSTNTQYNSALQALHILSKPAQAAVTNGGGAEQCPTGGNTCSLVNYSYNNNFGNLTTETKCILPSGTYPSVSCPTPQQWPTQYTYDGHGQVLQMTEGGASTNYTWAGQGGGDLTKVTYPNGAFDQYTYSAYTGEMLTHVDWNDNTTAYAYADPLNRNTSITLPATIDGTTGSPASGVTTYSYVDSPGSFSVGEQQTVNSQGENTQTTTSFDGLGRKFKTQTSTPEECSSSIEVDTLYDSMSRVSSVSNPYCSHSDPTYGITQFFYDGLGRKIETEFADSSISTITYAANWTEFTDPSNGTVTPQHIQQVNGLGQLNDVCEVTTTTFGPTAPANCGLGIPGTGYTTTYSYDPLNNLNSVSQHGSSRSFTYDALSRLLSATNPETGQVTYTYPSSSLPCATDTSVPCSKTDHRGVTVSYGYEIMNRLTSKTYSGSSSPISCYQYDSSLVPGAVAGNGPTGGNLEEHLTNAWTQTASSGTCSTSGPSTFITLKSFLAYDPVGRPYKTLQQTCIAGNCTTITAPQSYPITMSHDLIGDMTMLNNPVGANNSPLILTNYFNSAARQCLTTSSWTQAASPNIFEEYPTPNSTSPGYSPAGGLQNFYLGSTNSNAGTACSFTPASPVNVVLNYSTRFWVSGQSATGLLP